MRVLNPSSLVRCAMERIICHWSEGNYRANEVDLRAYHILIEGDGNVRFGQFGIADNLSTADRRYAAHTLHCNTRSIGVACCCMVGCRESPFAGGGQPLKREQWDRMVEVVADLSEYYRIPVTPKTVLGHGEVQDNLGIRQRGKWDPLVWPWDSSTFDVSRTRYLVGDRLRAQVAALLTRPAMPARVVETLVTSAGTVVTARVATFLRSSLFARNDELEAIAAGHRVLRTSARPSPDVGVVQDGLNQLADAGKSDYRIDLGPANRFRGYFGQRTERAVFAFQRELRLREDGVVGEATIIALDAVLRRLEHGRGRLADAVHKAAETVVDRAKTALPRIVTRSGYAPAPASAQLFHAVDFSLADEQAGRHFREAYAAADRDLYRGDPSNCKALLRFADGTVYYDAKMAICADGSPRAKEIDRPYGQIVTAFTFPSGGADSYFDAEQVPYIILPGKSRDGTLDFAGSFGIGKRDLAVVIHRGQVAPAFFGEIGPTFRLGEASIKVHEGLPVPVPWTSPRKDRILNASVPGNVIYCVFPSSAVRRTGGMSGAEWLAETCRSALDRFQKFVANGGNPPSEGASAG